jgi:hypothetical protein
MPGHHDLGSDTGIFTAPAQLLPHAVRCVGKFYLGRSYSASTLPQLLHYPVKVIVRENGWPCLIEAGNTARSFSNQVHGIDFGQ